MCETLVVGVKHDLLEFWKRQKLNLSAHIKSGHWDYAQMILDHLADAAWNDDTLKQSVKEGLIGEIEAMLSEIEGMSK